MNHEVSKFWHGPLRQNNCFTLFIVDFSCTLCIWLILTVWRYLLVKIGTFLAQITKEFIGSKRDFVIHAEIFLM